MKMFRWLRREWFQVLLLALPFAFAAAWWNEIPPVVTTHWGLSGRPDGWMSKAVGPLLLPVVNVAVSLLTAVLWRTDPLLHRNPDANTAHQRRLWNMYRHVTTGAASLFSVVLIASWAGWNVDLDRLFCEVSGVLLAWGGNYFGNLKPNYVIGIRNRWTLENPGTWRVTHRITGRWMAAAGLAVFGAGFVVSDRVQLLLLLGCMVGLVTGSTVYSAWHFHRRPQAA